MRSRVGGNARARTPMRPCVGTTRCLRMLQRGINRGDGTDTSRDAITCAGATSRTARRLELACPALGGAVVVKPSN